MTLCDVCSAEGYPYDAETCKECKYNSNNKGSAEWADNKCSICGKGIENLIDSREWYENEKPNYCPFCGTRFVMKGR